MAIFRKELKSYFSGMLGWLFSAFLLLFAGIYTMVYHLANNYTSFENVVAGITFIYMIAVPVLTMRSIAEEKHSRTDQLLYALPVKLSHIVMGKFLALCAVLLMPVAVIGTYPVILSQFGTMNFASIYTALLGFFLLGAALLSIGLFISSVTESQVSAAVLTLVTMMVLYFIGQLASFVPTESIASLIALCIAVAAAALVLFLLVRNWLVSGVVLLGGVGGLYGVYCLNSAAFSGLFAEIMTGLSLFDRFDVFVSGVLDLNGVVYFLSITGVMLFLTVQAMEKRRWS